MSRFDAMYPACGPDCNCGMLCKRASAIEEHYASRMAFMLECLLVDPHGHWNAAAALLDEYKAEWEKVNPRPPTFMGEPITGEPSRNPVANHAETSGSPVAWRPIETAPKGRTVLVHYKNRLGKGRTMRACYYPPDTLESDIEESGWANEGWYEESEAYEYLMPMDGDPTHWMPLPPPPDAAPAAPQEPSDVRCPDCLGSEFPGFKRGGVRCATCNGTATVVMKDKP